MGVPRKVALMTCMNCALDQSIAPDPMRGVKPTKARCRPIPIGTQTQKNKAASITEAAADRAPRRVRTQRRRRARPPSANASSGCVIHASSICDPCDLIRPTGRPDRTHAGHTIDRSNDRCPPERREGGA